MMKARYEKKLLTVLQYMIPILIFIGMFWAVSVVLIPNFVYQNSNAPTTSTVKGFYKIRKNTVDVLILGTSHFVNGCIPQEIYDEEHIRSYNLASEQQSIFLSYYLLKEAIRHQELQAVILDTKFVEGFHDEYPINMGDELFRKVSDRMRLSPVKIEMINDYCRLNGSEEKLSYFIPAIRYHNRWRSLTKEDLEVLTYKKHNELKGFYPLYHQLISGYEPITPEDDERIPMDPIMREYLEKITALCRDKGIKLILFRTPDKSTTVEIHNEIQAYAAENGLAFYDLNDRKYYDELEIKEPEEVICESDGEHANLPAAVKISEFLVKRLKENGVTGMEDEQWEATHDYYEEIFKDPLYVKRKY